MAALIMHLMLIIAGGVILGLIILVLLPWIAAGLLVLFFGCVQAMWEVFDTLVLAPVRGVTRFCRWIRSKLA